MNDNPGVNRSTIGDMPVGDMPVGGMPAQHWLWQTLPPVSMLGVLLATRSGTSLVYLVGLLLLPVLFSLISIIAKLVRFRARRNYLLRPILTIAMFGLILLAAEWTYVAARSQTLELASAIQQQCQQTGSCPETPPGWRRQGSDSPRLEIGAWLQYIAIYHHDHDRFRIRLYRGPDTGAVFRGGAYRELSVEAYTDG